ncbi:MAG: hypothetical protein R2939_07470 [Kofleriaceae bacterium]
MTWTAHPARRRPQDVMLVVAALLLTAWAVTAGLGSAYLAVLAVVILTISVAPFWAPTRYVVDDTGVEARRLGRVQARRWADLRRVLVGPGAALVTPLPRPSWLDRYRGVLLYFDGLDGDRRAEVVAALRARVGAGEAAS